MKFVTKFFTDCIETVVRKVLADEQFKSMVGESVKTQFDNLDYGRLAEELHERDVINYRELAKHVDADEIAQNVDTGEIENKVVEQIDMDSVTQGVVDAIDTDDIAEQVREHIEIDYSEIEIDYQALGRALVDLAATRRYYQLGGR